MQKNSHHIYAISYSQFQKFCYKHYPKKSYHVKQAKMPSHTVSNNLPATQLKPNPNGLSAHLKLANLAQIIAILQVKP